AEVDAIYQKMVAKSPDDRYPSMTEVVRALEGIKGLAATGPLAGSAPPAAPTEYSLDAGSADTLVKPAPTRRAIDLVVVLVEPSRTQAGIIRKYLQQLGVDKVHTTDSGKQAI